RIFAIDLNSDGIQDVAYSKYNKTSNDYSWVALISNGSGFSPEIELNSGHRFFLTGQELESRFQIMDFNGDGLSDILHAHTDVLGGKWNLTVLLNNSVAGGSPALSAPIELDISNADLFPFDVSDGWGMDIRPPYFDWASEDVEKKEIPDARVFDFNGDGAVDLLIKVWRHYRSCVANCGSLSSTNNGASQGGKFKEPVYEYRFASFWVLMESNGRNAFTRHSIVAMGEGCTLVAICQKPEYDDLPRSDYVWPVDINADGLADLAWGDSRRDWYFQINTGNGFMGPELISQVAEGANEVVRFEDWNGDSYPDLIYPSSTLNDNARWMINQNHFGRTYAAATNTLVLAGNVGGDSDSDPVENDASVFADFNGDGKTDQLLINNNSNGEILSSSIRKGMNVSGSREVEAANVITTITNGFGAITEISYKPLTDNSVYSRMHDAGNVAWGNGSAVYDLVAPLYVVSQVESSAPVYNAPSARSQVQYHYVGAKLQAGGRGFLGFGEVISYNPQSQIRTNSRYRQDFPFTGLLIDTTRVSNAAGYRFDPLSDTQTSEIPNWGVVSSSTSFPSQVSGTPLGYVLNQWESENTTGAAIFPNIADSIELEFTLQGTLDRKTLAASNYDAYGNLLSAGMSVYDDKGVFFAGETTGNAYSNNTAKWFIGQRLTSRVTYTRAGQSSITRHFGFTYDPVSGVLNQEVTEPGSNVFRVTTDYLLDSFGNRKQTTVTAANMPPRKVIERYDSLGRYVNENLNALFQTTQKVYERDVFGNPLELENIDGVVTTGAADLMGKPFVSFTETGVWNKTLVYNGRGSKCPLGTSFYTSTITGGKPDQMQCYDLLGRLSRTAI
ncbi:MAG: FG-GAP-like repeat-containing protein, partial [Xanthomonadales bacterium]|nr:FG-GAP-like repeat-containing protein [Xanthomonadales bacterium]